MPSRNGWDTFTKGPHECNKRWFGEKLAVVEPAIGIPAAPWAVSIAGEPIDFFARTHHLACEAAEATYYELYAKRERVSTHYTECWREHNDCAIAEIERLTSELSESRSELANGRKAMQAGEAIAQLIGCDPTELMHDAYRRAAESLIKERDQARSELALSNATVVVLSGALKPFADEFAAWVCPETAEYAPPDTVPLDGSSHCSRWEFRQASDVLSTVPARAKAMVEVCDRAQAVIDFIDKQPIGKAQLEYATLTQLIIPNLRSALSSLCGDGNVEGEKPPC